jgi:hypothetical protein
MLRKLQAEEPHRAVGANFWKVSHTHTSLHDIIKKIMRHLADFPKKIRNRIYDDL